MIRPATPDELDPWVKSSWLKSYKTSSVARIVTPRLVWDGGRAAGEYWEGQRELIAQLLKRAEVTVYESEDAPGMCDGWLCKEGPMLHYVYVRFSARGRGVARALVGAAFGGEAPVRYTHVSWDIDKRRLPRHWVHGFYDLMTGTR